MRQKATKPLIKTYLATTERLLALLTQSSRRFIHFFTFNIGKLNQLINHQPIKPQFHFFTLVIYLSSFFQVSDVVELLEHTS